jgi:hypothetical protein
VKILTMFEITVNLIMSYAGGNKCHVLLGEWVCECSSLKRGESKWEKM